MKIYDFERLLYINLYLYYQYNELNEYIFILQDDNKDIWFWEIIIYKFIFILSI